VNVSPSIPQTKVSTLEGQRCACTEARRENTVNRLGTVCDTLSDSEYRASEVGRLITEQIGEVVQEIFCLSFTVEDQLQVHHLVELIKVLRQLTPYLIRDQTLRQRQDTVNLDGEKFRFSLTS